MRTKEYNDYKTDLTASNKAMQQIYDTILQITDSNTIYPLETRTDEISQLIDMKSGGDYLLSSIYGIRLLASRVQFNCNYKSFTIRSERHTGTETELSKREYQIDNDYIYPYWTSQLYIVDNKPKSFCVIKTKELYRLLNEQPQLFESKVSDNEFYVIYWGILKRFVNKNDIKIIEW